MAKARLMRCDSTMVLACCWACLTPPVLACWGRGCASPDLTRHWPTARSADIRDESLAHLALCGGARFTRWGSAAQGCATPEVSRLAPPSAAPHTVPTRAWQTRGAERAHLPRLTAAVCLVVHKVAPVTAAWHLSDGICPTIRVAARETLGLANLIPEGHFATHDSWHKTQLECCDMCPRTWRCSGLDLAFLSP